MELSCLIGQQEEDDMLLRGFSLVISLAYVLLLMLAVIVERLFKLVFLSDADKVFITLDA